MSNHIENFPFEQELTLNNSSNPLTIHTTSLSLIKQNDKIIECRLTHSINLELYQRIEREKLFNLKTEVRAPMKGGNFLPDSDIQIETTLQPDLLPSLLEKASTAQEIANYLLQLSQKTRQETEAIENPLLNTESWLCLGVKQQQSQGSVGYNTFWNYVNPSTINHPEATSEQISKQIVDFFQQWTQANLSEVTQNVTKEFLEEISNVFGELVDENFSNTEELISTKQSIFNRVVDFFELDDWQFVKIPQTSTLRLLCGGRNGQWTCYGKAREEVSQFVFYSVCPVKVPSDKDLAIIEFITRANSGMIMGNFEFDFTDGEIRYKTSIDVEGDRLSFALIKQMVYANVTMMDEYLPGIMAVIESNVEVSEAISRIEG